jgi:hypothetical protein
MLRVARYQFTLRNGMEEVTGSIPVRSTKTSLRKTQRNAKVSAEAGFFYCLLLA